MTLLIGPLVAVFGVLAAFIVIRGRVRTRRNLYASLRADRERRIREAKERALAPVRTRPGAPVTAYGTPGGSVATQPAVAFSSGAPPAAPVPTAPRRVTAPLPQLPTPHRPYANTITGHGGAPGSAQADGETPEPSPRRGFAMAALSYASLIAAVVVVALGVVLMIEASTH